MGVAVFEGHKMSKGNFGILKPLPYFDILSHSLIETEIRCGSLILIKALSCLYDCFLLSNK